MEVILFSNSLQTRLRFAPLEQNRSVNITYLPCSSLKSDLKEAHRDAFVYVDISGQGDEDKERLLYYVRNYGKQRYGIIDPEGWIRDVGMLFHNGAVDYIGTPFNGSITIKRVKKALALRPYMLEDSGSHKRSTVRDGYILSGNDWQRIRSGQEYAFALMYIELENKVELKKNLSDVMIGAADNSFRSYIEQSVSQYMGRVWIWNDFEGIVLFPFDGTSCDAVSVCFGIVLSRKIYSVENPYFNRVLSFSIALHLGNTVYRRSGDTGTIISDSINTVFNVGRKFGEQGNFYLTRQVLEYAPPGMENCFVPAGRFEGFEIMRMRLPI